MAIGVRKNVSASVDAKEWGTRQLARYNQRRLAPGLPTANFADEMLEANRFAKLEHAFIAAERAAVRWQAADAPQAPGEFVTWFAELRHTGPGQGDPLFAYLAEQASIEELTWFLTQEVAGEAGFDDLTALTQLKLPTRAKLELGRNFWDELGRGNEGGVHGLLLQRLVTYLNVAPLLGGIVWESLALGNLLIALAVNRRYAYHSLGALGVIELTAPERCEMINAGLHRLGVPAFVRQYFALHATLDMKHSEAWNREVLRPIVASDPRTASAIAEGALLRLTAGARCYERYRRELHLKPPRRFDASDTRMRPTALGDGVRPQRA